MSEKLLSVKNLTKVFSNKTVVNDLSFHINEKEILGILGPNGAGKSTTFNIISGLLKPDKGEICLTDNDMNVSKKQYKSNMGVVPQEISLYESMTIQENLLFLGKLYGVRGKKLKERVESLIEDVQLTEKKHTEVGKLSGGMKRRVNIAAALVHLPKLVIMDEPTVGIDPQSRSVVWDIIRSLREKGISVIITSHYVDEIERLSDRVLIIDLGKVIAEGTVESLVQSHCNSKIYTVEFYDMSDALLKEIEMIQDVNSIDIKDNVLKIITTKDLNIIENIIKAANKHKLDIKNIDFKKPGLEDVFFHFTGKGLRE